MEKKKWETLYNSISEQYDKFYQNTQLLKNGTAESKKKATKDNDSVVTWVTMWLDNNIELRKILLDVTQKKGGQSTMIKNHNYFLEIVKEVLKEMQDKIDELE